MNAQRRRPGPPDTQVVGPGGVADLDVQGVEGAGLVEDRVDDEPVVEEGAVGHVEAEHAAHGTVGAVAADDVAGTDGRCLARPPKPQAAVPVRLDVDAFAMHGGSGAVVIDGGPLTPRRTSIPDSSPTRANSSASSSGWENIDDCGQPDRP
jgi:hypothetical protein